MCMKSANNLNLKYDTKKTDHNYMCGFYVNAVLYQYSIHYTLDRMSVQYIVQQSIEGEEGTRRIRTVCSAYLRSLASWQIWWVGVPMTTNLINGSASNQAEESKPVCLFLSQHIQYAKQMSSLIIWLIFLLFNKLNFMPLFASSLVVLSANSV
jgi:hypothetical protein